MTSITTRKVIQIQALRLREYAGEDQEPEDATELIALCDDGTIWAKYASSGWIRVEDIPQTNE